jgi:hypothetical protein
VTEENINIKPEVLKSHLLTFFKSLKNYPDKYLHRFFVDTTNPPEHFAYICPLCIVNGIIVENSIGLGMHSDFSLDHYPPESVGGFKKILVCKKCNNDAGTLFDFSLKEKIQQLAFFNRTPDSALKSKFIATDLIGNYPSQMTIDNDGNIEISLKPNPKMHAPFLDRFIEYSKDNLDYKIEVTQKIPDEKKVSKALVKTAYLTCFDMWGYEFVFSNTGEMIRKFLSDECEYPVLNPSFWLGNIAKTEVERMPLGLCYLKQPIEWRSFVINICLQHEESGFSEIASILIPGPLKEDWENLKDIQNLLNENPVATLSIAHVTENLINDNIFDGYTKNWQLLNENK